MTPQDALSVIQQALAAGRFDMKLSDFELVQRAYVVLSEMVNPAPAPVEVEKVE